MNEKLTTTVPGRQRITALYCSVLTREVAYCVARSRNIITPHGLPSQLHDLGAEKMRARLQEEIDRLDDGRADAIALLYGLCNNGVAGLQARRVPLVIARAHDCITWLLGSKERYAEVFRAEPGTYYFTPGWIESPPQTELGGDTILTQMGMPQLQYDRLVEQYGEDNARYLMEAMAVDTHNYTRYLWIASELGDFPEYQETIHQKARADGKRFEVYEGTVSLIQRALDGDWDGGDFTVCPPGHRLVARPATTIIEAVKAS